MGKLSLGLGLGIGYVLGAQAGRDRYEQIKKAASGLVQRPEVRQALEKARDTAPAPLQARIDKLAGGGSGGQDTGSANAETDAGGPPRADGPLPDPLIPPARSS